MTVFIDDDPSLIRWVVEDLAECVVDQLICLASVQDLELGVGKREIKELLVVADDRLKPRPRNSARRAAGTGWPSSRLLASDASTAKRFEVSGSRASGVGIPPLT